MHKLPDIINAKTSYTLQNNDVIFEVFAQNKAKAIICFLIVSSNANALIKK